MLVDPSDVSLVRLIFSLQSLWGYRGNTIWTTRASHMTQTHKAQASFAYKPPQLGFHVFNSIFFLCMIKYHSFYNI